MQCFRSASHSISGRYADSNKIADNYGRKEKNITVKGTYIKSKTFKSSKTNITTVSKKGVVTAKKAGNCKITVTVKYRKTKNAKNILSKNLTCNVTVKDAQPVLKNKEDVAAINTIIAEQKALGATVSEDLDSNEYGWSTDGRLVEINWESKNLQGILSLQGLPQLDRLECGNNPLTNLNDNQLTNLDVSKNTVLTYLACYGNQLTNLDVSRNTALTHLDCIHNQLTNLDVNNCPALTSLRYDENVEVIGKPDSLVE